MASSDTELAEQLKEAGNMLMSPPPSVDELLPLLDQVENCLSRVEQSPSTPMQDAISPSLKALVTEQLFRHQDADVKAAVASCISEITRITAPEAPYDDDKMKEVFQLIVSSFENLFDNTNRSYSKRTSILETVAKVRSCVVMLDLECDALIIEMFQHFLKSIRDYHPENVFQSMETIMTLVLEESEDISTELLSPLLASVKKDDEEVLPVARKLAEKVLESCATKLKPYLTQAVNKLGISFDDYSEVVSSICHQESSDAVEQNDATANEPVADDGKPAEEALDEKAQEDKEISGEAVPAEADLTNEKLPKSVVSNGIPEPKEDETSNSLKKQDEGQAADQSKNTDASSTAEPDNLATDKLNLESKIEQNTKKRGNSSSSSKLMEPSDGSHDEKEAEAIPEHKNDGKDPPGSAPEHQSDGKDASGAASEEQPVSAVISSENKEETVIQPSSPKATDSKSAHVASPTASGNVPDESHPKMMERPKKKESLIKDITPSADDASKKTSEGTSDSEAKPNRHSGKKVADGKLNEEKTMAVTDEIKKESGTATGSETKPVKQAAKKVDASSNNADESASKQQEDRKRRSRGKGVSEKDETKPSNKNEEKETVASPKSVKSSKDEPRVEETPKTDLKRKLTPGKDKASGSKEYGENLVGSKVKVWWPIDKTFYEGVIDSFDCIKKKHKVLYNDGEQEILNLKRERWEFIQDDSESDEEKNGGQASPESSSDMPLKKKAKLTEQSTKQAKMDISPKTGGGGSSSKSKGKSNSKSKDGKVDSKSKDGSKTSNKSEDDSASRSKDHKAAGKSEDILSTPKTKSKQETANPSTAKDKPRKSSGKSNPNGTGKSKSGQSKVKESENVKENSTESAKGQESVKGKSSSSSKSGKKRRR
ncbi:hypothetical protein SLE2022_034460 [Rubroshorea leprosula]